MKNSNRAPDGSTLENQPANLADVALAKIRRSVANVLPKAAVTLSSTESVEDRIGEFRLITTDAITIPDRFRRDLGDLASLAQSIREVGLLQPILVNPELGLVGGMRRLAAYRLLGRDQILARVLAIEDEKLASIEEDRERKPLLPTEKFAITEEFRSRMQDEAWRRRALGGKLEKAVQRGRVDDLLAIHVGLSRPTLLKIRAIVEAARSDPSRYGQIAEALDRDAKVDRHHKEFLAERAKDNPNAKFGAIVLSPDWQSLETKILRKALAAAKIAEFADENSILLVPTSVKDLNQASGLIVLAKFGWVTSLIGSQSDSERLWLVATLGKTLPKEDEMAILAESCASGYSQVIDAAAVVTDGSVLPIDLAQIATDQG